MNKIYRWKNTSEEKEEPDIQIQEEEEEKEDLEERDMETMEEELSNISEKTHQIEVLISRVADLSHYRAFSDVDFVIDAIGKKDYEGSPALDVLPSNEEIDNERREKVKEYIYCLNSWAEGKSVEDAASEFKASEKLLRNIYIHLADFDEEKRELALSLSELLNGRVSSPEDVIHDISDEDFIIHVYEKILNRKPDDDDLKLRIMELRRGKTRQELIKDVLESKESSRRVLAEIAKSIESSIEG
jgi:hypothetical protein